MFADGAEDDSQSSGGLGGGGELCGEGICQDACIHFLRCNIYLCTYVCKEEDEKVCVGFLVTAT